MRSLILDLAPAAITWGAPGGSAFAKPSPTGPLSCIPNNNSANWSSELSLGLLEGHEGVSCTGVLLKGEDPNSWPDAALPRVPTGMEK